MSRYDEYMTSNDDRYLAMKVHNYTLWSPLDDYSYWYDSRYSYYYNPYVFGMNNSFYYPNYNNYYNNGGYGWYSWQNPVYTIACYKNPWVSIGSTSGSNITAYRNKNYSNSNYHYYTPKSINYSSSDHPNSFGALLRKTFTPAPSTNNGAVNNNTYSNPVRLFTPSAPASSSTPSSSAGGSSGGYNSTGTNTNNGRGGRGN